MKTISGKENTVSTLSYIFIPQHKLLAPQSDAGCGRWKAFSEYFRSLQKCILHSPPLCKECISKVSTKGFASLLLRQQIRVSLISACMLQMYFSEKSTAKDKHLHAEAYPNAVILIVTVSLIGCIFGCASYCKKYCSWLLDLFPILYYFLPWKQVADISSNTFRFTHNTKS